MLVFALSIAVGILVWVGYNLIGEIGGAAFVPTGQKEIDRVLAKLNLKPGKKFYDLGSGDGRVVRTAVEKFGVKGVGVELNPWLVWWSNLKNCHPNLQFVRKDFWKMDLSDADYIYFYQSPRAAKRLGKKMNKEGKSGLIIISKAFEIRDGNIERKRTVVIENRSYFIYQT